MQLKWFKYQWSRFFENINSRPEKSSLCADCRSELLPNAKKCANCGSYTNVCYRWVLGFTGVISTIATIGSFIVLFNAFTKFFDLQVDFEATAYCSYDKLSVSVQNLEGNEAIRIEGPQNVLVNSSKSNISTIINVTTAMKIVVPVNYPYSEEVFLNDKEAKEQFQSLCEEGCSIKFDLIAANLDYKRTRIKSLNCDYTESQISSDIRKLLRDSLGK